MSTVTEPGLIFDMPEDQYHADPVPGGSLSSTEAKEILKSPAHLAHYRQNRTPPKPEFDFGSAVHTLALGTGWPIEPLDFDSFRTKEAKEAADKARAEDKIPVLQKIYEEVSRVANAVLAHPIAGALLSRQDIATEVSSFGPTGDDVWLRGRFDVLIPGADIIVDLKTTQSANPADFARAAYTMGYDVQAEHYRQCYQAATGRTARSFIHILVEKTAPYLVSVVELDKEFQEIGAMRHARAIARYKHATVTGEWPGYPTSTIHQIAPENWMTYREEDLQEATP